MRLGGRVLPGTERMDAPGTTAAAAATDDDDDDDKKSSDYRIHLAVQYWTASGRPSNRRMQKPVVRWCDAVLHRTIGRLSHVFTKANTPLYVALLLTRVLNAIV